MNNQKKLGKIILKLLIIGIVATAVVITVELVGFACDDDFWNAVGEEEPTEYFYDDRL